MDFPDPIPLSALQHWCYCPRQCALIHVEQVFADNLHTLRGQAVHKQVDQSGVETRAGLRVERALPVFSVLNLIVRPEARDAFTMDGRTRRPPLDRMNALLSFLYSMLMKTCAPRSRAWDSIRNWAFSTRCVQAVPRWRSI